MSEKQNSRFTEHRVPNVYCSRCWQNERLVEVVFRSIVPGGGNIYVSTGHLFCPNCNKNLGMFSGDTYRSYWLKALDPDNRERIFI